MISRFKNTIMKKYNMLRLAILALTVFLLPHSMKAQDDKEKEKIISESKNAKAEFIKTDPSMSKLFTNSYGYVIFPKVGKGAIVVGGSGGNGAVYEKGKIVGTAKMAQVTVGAQVGGES